ncbi:MAG: cytochrome c family protein [Gammaproteobacteria bacterium]|nr:cytochrome c family protein [Gammaproteobacteria bacterium]MDH3767238.1 cytochrome c family protein [Gammaproteobacteria bacterium]
MSVSVLAALRTFKKHALIVLAVIVGFTVGHLVNANFYSDDAPVQPIEFSHRIHAAENEIPCMHCHVHAATSINAGVPSVNKCMNCHRAMPGVWESPEILKVRGYWERSEPIPWVKVYDLPDFVYFPHKRHIQAEVECQSCHGDVQEMDRVEKVSPLKMQWCLDCHKTREVENGRDCWTCHK